MLFLQEDFADLFPLLRGRVNSLSNIDKHRRTVRSVTEPINIWAHSRIMRTGMDEENTLLRCGLESGQVTLEVEPDGGLVVIGVAGGNKADVADDSVVIG